MFTFKQPYSEKTGKQIGINLFSVCVALPLLVALMAVSLILFKDLQRIETLALSTSNSHLPQILAKQQVLLNIENMRRTIAMIYNAPDAESVRGAGITAQALVSESAFGVLPEVAEELGRVRPKVRRLIELKQRMFRTEELFHRGEIALATALGRLSLRMAERSGKDLPHSSHSLALGLSEETEADYAKTLAVLEPVLRFCAGTPQQGGHGELEDCGKLRASWRNLTEGRKELLPAGKEARQLWQSLDGHLRELGDTVSIFEADWIHRSMSIIDEEIKRIKTMFPLLGMAVLGGLLFVLVLVHRLLLWPLSLMSRSLRIIRSGHAITPLPPARISELQDILDVLPDISRYMDELNSRSDRLAQERDQYADLSYKDGLTGVYNRRALEESLSGVSQRTALALLMLDLDFFKTYNDRFGHQAGDAALKTVADILCKSLMRASDKVFRYGGEEFTVILPGADVTEALVVAERILQEVAGADLIHPSSETGRITVSIGVACRRLGEGCGVETVLAQADQALYRAKATGRNRIVVYGVK